MMLELWPISLLETVLTSLVVLSTAVTIFMLTVPFPYSHFEPGYLTENEFNEHDKANAEKSGYKYFSDHKDEKGRYRIDVSIQVVVLGDIGRSPRMQYHALSIAARGGLVYLVGYAESEVHPDIQANRYIEIVPLRPYPKILQTRSRALFPLIAPLKVIWQVWSLYHALGYRSPASKWMLIQNPPSIPTLAVAQFICFFRRTKLVIDWHNFGYSILALRLGLQHLLVKVSEWYEGFFARGATAHFAVTDAMVRVLKQKWNIGAVSLHDRPPKYFQPLSTAQQSSFLKRLPETANISADLENKAWRLIVSSTSWTPDEDFSLLLDALVDYCAAKKRSPTLPKLLAIITGKGPQKSYFATEIQKLNDAGKLPDVVIRMAWLSSDDYASLLGSADLGISLHTSSSGVDLPMKVVDMFGAGLPVIGWSKFEAWPELVQEGSNGCGFGSSRELATLLQELFDGDGKKLERLKTGALEASKRRWDDEWMPVAGRVFELKP